jgi:hypothetical protein
MTPIARMSVRKRWPGIGQHNGLTWGLPGTSTPTHYWAIGRKVTRFCKLF